MPAILTRLEVTGDDCFVLVAAIFNRFRVSIRKALRGDILPLILSFGDWAENRRQDALRSSGQADATSACSVHRGAGARLAIRSVAFSVI